MLVMAIGLFVLGAAISFGIWAATGGFYRPTTVRSPSSDWFLSPIIFFYLKIGLKQKEKDSKS